MRGRDFRHSGVDEARRDAVDANSVARPRLGQGAGETDGACLGGVIGRIAAGGVEGRRRADCYKRSITFF